MTNLDIMTTLLAETTGFPVTYWDHCVRCAIAERGLDIATDTALLHTVPEPEARRLLSALRKEKSGILAWLVEGAVKARAGVRPKRSPVERVP